MGSANCVFFDDRDTASVSGFHLVPVPATKHGVLMDREHPWEAGGVSVFAGSVCQLDDRRFRMYYYSHCPSPRRMRIMIAESADGFVWERVPLGQYQHEGLDTNVVVIEGVYEGANVTQPSVVRLPDGRWRMYSWLHGQDRGLIRYIISESDDGLRWKTIGIDRPAIFHPSDLEAGQVAWTAGLTRANPNGRFETERTWDFMAAKRIRSNDATNVYYNEASGRFEMFSVWLLPNLPERGRQTPHDNAPGALRVIHRRTSEDGLVWSDPELVIMPADTDPITQQFYYLSQHREPDFRVGFLGNYHCWAQTMELEMCFSRDGRVWQRPLPGPFVPRGAIPEGDCMSMYATNTLLPVLDDRWLLLYRGGNTHHNHTVPDGVGEAWYGIMGLTWPRGRFAGLATNDRSVGRMLLKPKIQTEDGICVNGNIRGALRAELRDPLGGRLPGYELHACHPVTGDSGDHVLRWGDDGHTSAPYQYDAVTLYLEVTDGIVYSVSV